MKMEILVFNSEGHQISTQRPSRPSAKIAVAMLAYIPVIREKEDSGLWVKTETNVQISLTLSIGPSRNNNI